MARHLLPLLLLLPCCSLAQSSHCPPTHTPHFELVTGKVGAQARTGAQFGRIQGFGVYMECEKDPKCDVLLLKLDGVGPVDDRPSPCFENYVDEQSMSIHNWAK